MKTSHFAALLVAAACFASALDNTPEVAELQDGKPAATLSEEEDPLWVDFKKWRKEYNQIMRSIKATPLDLEMALGKINGHPDDPLYGGLLDTIGPEDPTSLLQTGESKPLSTPQKDQGFGVDKNGYALDKEGFQIYPHKHTKEEEMHELKTANFKPKMPEKNMKMMLRAELIDMKKQQKLIHSGKKPKKYSNMHTACEKYHLSTIDMYYPGDKKEERKLGEGLMAEEDMKGELMYREAQLEHVRRECMPIGMTSKKRVRGNMAGNFPAPYPVHYDSKNHEETFLKMSAEY